MDVQKLFQLSLGSAAHVLSLLSSVSGCHADETAPRTHHFETYGGLAYDGIGFASYSSAVWSPYTDVSKEGFRLRTGNLTSIYGDGAAAVWSGAFAPKSSLTTTDAELGYQLNYNWLWLKVYAGAALQTDLKLWSQVGALRQVQGWGATLSVETWSQLSDRAWISANTRWVGIGNAASIYVRAGYGLMEFENKTTVAFGIEGSVARDTVQDLRRLKTTNRSEDYASGGLFANVQYGVHDISLSGGLSQSSTASGDANPHVTFTYGRKF